MLNRSGFVLQTLATFSLLALFLTVPDGSAQAECFDYESAIRWVGNSDVRSEAFATTGDLAVSLVWEREVEVLDISDPMQIEILGSMEFCCSSFLRIAAAGDRAYTAGWDPSAHGVLSAIDISDPHAPTLLGQGWTANILNDVALDDTYVYVVDKADLTVFDPKEVDYVWHDVCETPLPYEGLAIAVEGDYAYIAASDGGLLIYDLTGLPDAMSLVGSVDTPGRAVDVAVSGTLAYIADGASGLAVVDVSDPASPSLEAVVETPESHMVAVDGSNLYVGIYRAIVVFDLADPADPQPVGSLGLPWSPATVETRGERTLVACAYLTLYDLTPKISPPILSSVPTLDESRDIEVAGTLAFVSEYRAGVRILDVADPLNPQVLGAVDTSGVAYGVDVVGGLVYVAAGSGCLQVIDASDPSNPFLTGVCEFEGRAYDVEVHAGFAYVIASYSTLLIFDLADPTNPILATGLDTPFDVEAFDLAGEFAFIAATDNEADGHLLVVDVSDPYDPQIVADLEVEVPVCGVLADGDYLYINASYEGLLTVDISDPLVPIVAGSAETPRYLSQRDLDLQDGILYVPCLRVGIVVIDVRDPLNPVSIGQADTPGAAFSTAPIGDYLLVGDEEGGVAVFARQCLPAAVPGGSSGIGSCSMLSILPNPSTGRVEIGLSLPCAPDPVRLLITDVSGRLVRTLPGNEPRTEHRLTWDGRDDRGRKVANGVYLVRLEGGPASEAGRIVLAR